MAVTFRSVGVSPGANSTSCVVVKPVGLAVGDLMIAHVVAKRGDQTYTAPGGWTEIRNDSTGGSLFDIRSSLFWKIADQGDVDATDFTFTTGDSGITNLGAISAWTGHDPSTPINANNGQANAASTTITSPAITPSVANCVILMLCGTGDNNTHSAYAIADDNPASWDERYDLLTIEGSDCSLAMGSAARPETSATGLGTATTSASDENIGQLVAIAPAVAIPPPVVGHLIGVAVIRKS